MDTASTARQQQMGTIKVANSRHARSGLVYRRCGLVLSQLREPNLSWLRRVVATVESTQTYALCSSFITKITRLFSRHSHELWLVPASCARLYSLTAAGSLGVLHYYVQPICDGSMPNVCMSASRSNRQLQSFSNSCFVPATPAATIAAPAALFHTTPLSASATESLSKQQGKREAGINAEEKAI